MRSRSCSKHGNRGMEVERLSTKEEPQLSGAYIRSLVKQLSSSRTKDHMNPKSPNGVPGDELFQDQTKLTESPEEAQKQQPRPPPQPKKQVRRRLHTSRPYQERLLNMAEARREIVTALKFHRAAMKQANEQQQHIAAAAAAAAAAPPPPQPSPPPLEEPHQVLNPRMYSPNSILPNYFHNPPLQPFTYPSSFSWPYTPIAPIPISDNLNLPLPNQTLGLNLNFQGFNIETPSYDNKPLLRSSSPPSSSSSYSYSSTSPPSAMSCLEVPSVSNGPLPTSETASDPASSTLHPVLDDEEMAEIRLIGEQHEMEWNDTVNLVTSAWWCKFLKNMEVDHQEGVVGVFDEPMDIPAWLSDGSPANVNDRCLLPHHFDDQHSDYLQDAAALPCLDIGEIEGLDGEWLS